MFKVLILKSLKFYQKILSPDSGLLSFIMPRGVCRFYPSCSEYAYRAIEKYGLVRGVWQSIKRIARCHPWNPGGVDFP